MSKKQKIVLNILPCILETVLFLLSALGLYASDKKMDIFPFNIVTYYAPFFFILCIILSPLYIAVLNLKFSRRGKILTEYFYMLGVLIFKLLFMNGLFMIFWDFPINVPLFVNDFLIIALYDVVMLGFSVCLIRVIKYLQYRHNAKMGHIESSDIGNAE